MLKDPSIWASMCPLKTVLKIPFLYVFSRSGTQTQRALAEWVITVNNTIPVRAWKTPRAIDGWSDGKIWALEIIVLIFGSGTPKGQLVTIFNPDAAWCAIRSHRGAIQWDCVAPDREQRICGSSHGILLLWAVLPLVLLLDAVALGSTSSQNWGRCEG